MKLEKQVSTSPCVLCGNTGARVLFESYGFDFPKERFELHQCLSCDLVRVHPFPDQAQLGKYYQSSYYGGSNQEKFMKPLEFLVRQESDARARKLSRMGELERARVLDIGCGRGNFLEAMHRKGHVCFGIEIEDFPTRPSRENLTFLNGTIENADYPNNSFDLISIWHVLEHVQNPATTVRKSSAVLKNGKILAIAVPNFGSFQRRLFQKHWFHLDLPRHLYHFTEETLARLLAEGHFVIERKETTSLSQNLFGFIQSSLNVIFPFKPNWLYSLMKHRTNLRFGAGTFGFALVQLFAAGVLLLPAVLESFFSMLLGKGATLIVYARKKAP